MKGLLPPRNGYIERIDDDHANARRPWIEMGKPSLPTQREVEQLHVASQIVRESVAWKFEAGALHLELTMPPQAVAAITVERMPKKRERKFES